jgi:hypothetical protein
MPDSLKDVECAQGIDFEILPGVLIRRGDRNLTGQVENHLRLLVVEHTLHGRGIPDIESLKANRRMLLHQPAEILIRAAARKVIDNCDVPAATCEVRGGIHADETSSTCYQDLSHLYKSRKCSNALLHERRTVLASGKLAI